MIVNINQAIKLLNQGEVIGIPTDTVYGFATIENSKDKIYTLKQRDKSKKLINFIWNKKQIGKVDDLDENEVDNIVEQYWPGANTLIFKQNNHLNSYRIPNNKNILELLKSINCKLLTTSANISGETPCLNAKEFVDKFPNIPLLEEKYKQQNSETPSKIYIISKDSIERIR